MACRLDGAKPLSEPMLEYCANIFIQENVFEGVVCEMAAILSRPQCVNHSQEGEELLGCARRWIRKYQF